MGNPFAGHQDERHVPCAKLSEISLGPLTTEPGVVIAAWDLDTVQGLHGEIFIGAFVDRQPSVHTSVQDIVLQLRAMRPSAVLFHTCFARDLLSFMYSLGTWLKQDLGMTPVPQQAGWFRTQGDQLDEARDKIKDHMDFLRTFQMPLPLLLANYIVLNSGSDSE